jgi:XTP/dITP diphosphohydrolase
MISICFATNNKHKIAEVRSKVGDEITILSLEDIGCFEELPETSPTLEGNSAQKARFVADKYKINCFADDTGLEVDVLNGEPGVYSARYAGPACNSEGNMDKLLLEMAGQNNRSAQFKTCITLIIDGKETIFHGTVKGTILSERHGKEGFGYDPIFQPEGYTVSFAEMPLSEKNTISHRALAVEQLIAYLKTI